ncbi:hypothetical protein OQA88_9153 [Cercophora sp. LCS_1]
MAGGKRAKGTSAGCDVAEAQADGAIPSLRTHIVHPGPELVHGDNGTETITRAQMQESVDTQDDCAFFHKLPLEIRRQIYREVWRSFLGSALRLHIYTDGAGRGTFHHTQCRLIPGSPVQDDVLEPWPFDSNTEHAPPMWFWFAWMMRLHWDKHWGCQSAIMGRWDGRTGLATDPESSPFLPVYWEAIDNLFNVVTPVFTSSEDVLRFFIQKPHPFLSSTRSLEFSFTNANDHLFLTRVQREQRASARGVVPALNGGTALHPCIGQQLWSELVRGIQTTIPGLRDFDITIGGRMAHDSALEIFGRCQAENDESGAAERDTCLWTLPGRLSVLFKSPDEQRYIQEGPLMVRQ